MGIFNKSGSLFSRNKGDNQGYTGAGRTGYYPPDTGKKKQGVNGTVRTKAPGRSGLTGRMNPVQQQTAMQGQAQQAFYNTNMRGNVPGGTYQQTGYNPGMFQGTATQANYTRTGYGQSPAAQTMQQTMPADDTGFGRKMPVQESTGTATGYFQQNTMQQPQQNVPAGFQGYHDEAGRLWRMRVNVVQLGGLSDCYPRIDEISKGQLVIASLERIDDVLEKQRCMDLLSGAAYVLGCRMMQLDIHKNLFLIAPGNAYISREPEVSQANAGQQQPRQDEGQGGNPRTYGFSRSRYA